MLLTTPERRLSMVLKQQELWQQGKTALVAALDRLLSLPFVDLLDESDELLSHRCAGALQGCTRSGLLGPPASPGPALAV